MAEPPDLVVISGATEAGSALRKRWPGRSDHAFTPFGAQGAIHLHRKCVDVIASGGVGGHLKWVRTYFGTPAVDQRRAIPHLWRPVRWVTAANGGLGTVRGVTIPPDSDAVENVELATLNEDWRLRPVDPRHVELLAAVLDRCPPIVVRRAGWVLLDGHARVAAARLKGRTTLPVKWFTGSDAEALEAAISANAQHGLPLTGPERTAALHALLELAPQWSNRRLAAAAGVSEATVRRARRPGASVTHLDSDILGADGKHYSRDVAIRRATATGLMRSRPDMSNRAIARLVGLSPTTVSKLRVLTSTTTKAPSDPDPTTPTQNYGSRTRGWAAWWTRIVGWLRHFTNPDKATRAPGRANR